MNKIKATPALPRGPVAKGGGPEAERFDSGELEAVLPAPNTGNATRLLSRVRF